MFKIKIKISYLILLNFSCTIKKYEVLNISIKLKIEKHI